MRGDRHRRWHGVPRHHQSTVDASFRRHRNFWRSAGRAYAGRVFGALGGLAAAGAANYFARVPHLDSSPMMSRRYGHKRSRWGPPVGRFDGVAVSKDAGGNTYDRGKVTRGRRLSKRRRIDKLVQSEKNTVVFRYNGVTSYSGQKGYYALFNFRNTVSGSRHIPMHLYDLTAILNNTGTGQIGAPVGYHMRLGSANDLGWKHLRGSTDLGADFTNNQMQLERGTTAQGEVFNMGAKGFLQWIDIRLVLYCMLTTPTRFTVRLVQFTDQDYVPTQGGVATTDGTTETTITNLDVYNFYANLTKPYISNPILDNYGSGKKYLKTLYKFDKIFQPRATIASDSTTPTSYELRIFKWINKIISYNWDESTRLNNTTTQQADDAFVREFSSNFLATPKHEKRIFLMIQAQALETTGTVNPIDADASAVSNGTSPTYDLMIRTKYDTLMST